MDYTKVTPERCIKYMEEFADFHGYPAGKNVRKHVLELLYAEKEGRLVVLQDVAKEQKDLENRQNEKIGHCDNCQTDCFFRGENNLHPKCRWYTSMTNEEYIEREAVKSLININFSGLLDAVDAIPAADVAPVVHGRWDFKNNGKYGQTRCYCTACGKHSGIGGIRENQMKPYCPNCGAKMDGERKDGEG